MLVFLFGVDARDNQIVVHAKFEYDVPSIAPTPWLKTYNQRSCQRCIVIRGNAVMFNKNIIFTDKGPCFSSPEKILCETPIKIS